MTSNPMEAFGDCYSSLKYTQNDSSDIVLNKITEYFLLKAYEKKPKSFESSVEEIYPEKKIIIKNKIHFFKKYMEGKFRPGHFEGVIEVVKRLLNHVKTNYLFLGKKDYQQLIIIKEYLKSINSKIIVVPCDTIRAKNGIALSSRNKLLNQKSLNTAGKIINFLKNNKNKIIKSKDNSLFLKKIKEFGVKKIDYLTAFDLKKLKKTNKSTVNTRVFIAYYLNDVRLIDNF